MPTTAKDDSLNPNQTKHVCQACISDKFLTELVEKKSFQAECSYCHATQVVITLVDLSNLIHQVLGEHFEPIPEDDFPEQYGFSLPDVETVIEEVAGLEQKIARDVKDYLLNHSSWTLNVSGEEKSAYSDDILYIEREADTTDFRSIWWGFKEEIQTRARYFGATTSATLEAVFENLAALRTIWNKPVIREIKPGDKDSSFWRARTAHSEAEVEAILASLSNQLGPPPSAKAKAGRMNAEGIPVFYGAIEEETCVSEVRAPVGSYVVLAKFELSNPIRVLDLNAMSNVYSNLSHFYPNYIKNRSRERFLNELVREIGKPIMPHEEARDYVATQIVSEYLANKSELSLGGIIFSSAQTGGYGHNIVLFNDLRNVRDYGPRPGTKTGFRVSIPPRPEVPAPGTESSQDLVIQVAPQRAIGQGKENMEDPMTSGPGIQGSLGDSILSIELQSLKVLAIKGVKYEFESLALRRDHYVSADPARFHLDIPGARVTAHRRNRNQE